MTATRLFDIPTSSPSWLDDPETANVLAPRRRARRARRAVHPRRLGAARRRAVRDGARPADRARPLRVLGSHAGRPPSSTRSPRTPNLRLKVTTTALESVADPRDVVERLRRGVRRRAPDVGQRLPAAPRRALPGDRRPRAPAPVRASSPAEQARFLGGTALELFPELAP